tara:strand:+ start:231 stop:554 length:324 start_codon:yes stop_codon:yes gene_type:complete
MGVSTKATPKTTQGKPVNKYDLNNSAKDKHAANLNNDPILVSKLFLSVAPQKANPQKIDKVAAKKINAKGAYMPVSFGLTKNGSVIHSNEEKKYPNPKSHPQEKDSK